MPLRKGNERRWTLTSQDGVEISVLRAEESGDGATSLLRLRAQARFPMHDHPGGEELFVVRGEVEVGGMVLSEGDFLWTQAGTAHSLLARTDCVLLVMAPKGIRYVE